MAAKNYLEFRVKNMTYTIEQMYSLTFAPDAIVSVYYCGKEKILKAVFYYKQMFNWIIWNHIVTTVNMRHLDLKSEV